MPRFVIRLVVTTLLIGAMAACDRPDTAASPGTISFAPSLSTSVQLIPQALPLVPMHGFVCPSSSPFATSFNLVVGAANSDLLFDRVTLQPFDVFGVGGRSTVLTSADLTGISGSALIRAGSTRRFALQPQFGCGLSLPQSLIAEVVLTDSFGSPHRTTLNASFRP